MAQWCSVLQMWCDDIDCYDVDLIGCDGYCRACDEMEYVD